MTDEPEEVRTIEAGACFIRKAVWSKGAKGREPNDRGYDRRLQRLTRKLKPEELNELLSD